MLKYKLILLNIRFSNGAQPLSENLTGGVSSSMASSRRLGQVLYLIVQRRRDTEAALKLSKRLFWSQRMTPEVIVTGGLKSTYVTALDELDLLDRHRAWQAAGKRWPYPRWEADWRWKQSNANLSLLSAA
jgi:hypothetical protein